MARHSSTTQKVQTNNSQKTTHQNVWMMWTAVIFMLFIVLPSFSHAQAPLEWAEGRILVQPRAGLSEEELQRILQRSHGKSKAKIGNLNVHVVEVPAKAEQAVVRALSHNPHVKFAEVDVLVEPDAFIPNDPVYPNQWHLSTIQAPIAWDSTQGEGITVAVLDTGVDGNHPDFQGQLGAGWNPVSNNTETSDLRGHGTAVAGVIGATTHNATAVAGVAGRVSIMPIRVSNLSTGSAYWSDIAKGLNWAADHGAEVANISYAITASSAITSAANYFRSKGGVVVTSAGNDGTNPGLSENPALVTVSATTQSDVRASWSNYGDYIDITAPGDVIYTTTNGGGTGAWWGTSFSSPVTAGVVALIMAQNPNLNPDEVEAVLKNSADDLGSALYYGAGRVNASRAVQMAGNTSGGGDTEAPFVSIINPARDASVSGWVTVDVNATDAVGVTKVVLYAGSVKVGEDMVAPYQFSWDSMNEPDGTMTLMAYAYDAANNEGSSGSFPVNVDNVPDTPDTTPPTVSIMNPKNGSIVDRTVQIRVTAADDVSLSSVKLYIDGAMKASANISPLDYSWNTRKVSSGTHTIKAVVMDGAGHSSTTQIQVSKDSSGRGSSNGGKGKKK